MLVNLSSAHADEEPFKILMLGDSLTAGYGLEKGAGFTDQLQQKINSLNKNIKIINAGVSGDTTQGGVARLNWALADKPDMVVVELGANDGLRGIDPDLTRGNLEKLIEGLQKKGLKILLAGMLAPPNLGEDYGHLFNAIYPDLAKSYGITLYPFFLDGVAGNPVLNQEDGIHPNREGVGVIVDRILPYILTVKEKG